MTEKTRHSTTVLVGPQQKCAAVNKEQRDPRITASMDIAKKRIEVAMVGILRVQVTAKGFFVQHDYTMWIILQISARRGVWPGLL